MTNTKKFSEFVPGGTISDTDEPVGLEAGTNAIWNYAGQAGGGDVEVVIDADTTNLAVGDWVRVDQASTDIERAIATSDEEAEVVGVVKEIISGTQFVLKQSGYIESGTPGFNGFIPGTVYFLSDTMLGKQTDVPPTTNGYVRKPLFVAETVDSGWVVCLNIGNIIGSPGPIGNGANTEGSPSIRVHNQAGNTFNIGDWVYVSADNTYSEADASSLATAQAVGVVTQAGDPDFTIQFSGWNANTVTSAVDDAGNPIALAATTVYYLSDQVAGAITPTKPTSLTSAVKPVFISESIANGTGWVLPQIPLEVTDTEGGESSIQTIEQIGHGLNERQWVRIDGAGNYVLAQADTLTNADAVGVVIRRIDDDNFILQQSGFTDAATWTGNLVAGQKYWLDPATPGGTVTVEPTGVGQISKPLLDAVDANRGWIKEQRPILNSGGGGGGGANDFINAFPYISGRYYPCVIAGTNLLTGFSTDYKINFVYYIPFQVWEDNTFDQIGWTNPIAGGPGVVNVALYNDIGTGLQPTGAPLAGTTTGSVPTALVGNRKFTFGAPLALTAGVYWIGFLAGTSAPSFSVNFGSINSIRAKGLGSLDVDTTTSQARPIVVGYTQPQAYSVVMPNVGALTTQTIATTGVQSFFPPLFYLRST